MAVFSASFSDNGDPYPQFFVPDAETGVPGSVFLPTGLRRSAQAGDARFIRRRPDYSQRRPQRGECFMMFGELFWFEHLHIIPKTLALGNVLTTQEREYEVFNGFRSQSRTVTSRAATGLDGITVEGEPTFSPVTVIGPKGTVLVSVTVSPVGPVTIDASITYEFDGGQSLTVQITGSRVVVVTLEPESEITERWEWLTDIITAASGDEQRIAARDVPRQSFEYTYIKRDEDVAELVNQLWGWGANTFAVPVWTDYTVLTSGAAAGATSLLLETTAERDFRADGELALLWKTDGTAEAVEVTAVGANSLSLARETSTAFEAGDLVIPLRLCKIDPSGWGASNRNANARIVETTWRVLDNVDFADALSPSPVFDGGVYRDLPVWDIDADHLITPGSYREVEARALTEPANDGTGKVSLFTERKFPQNVVSGLSLQAFGRTEFFRLRAFLHYFRGRQRAFWMSTGRNDFTVESTTTAPTTEVNVNVVGYTNLVINAPFGPRTRRNIEIVYADGAKDYRRIVSSQLSAGVREVLTLDSAVSQDVSKENVTRISFLVKRRLDVDTVDFEHLFYQGDTSVPRLAFADVYDGE